MNEAKDRGDDWLGLKDSFAPEGTCVGDVDEDSESGNETVHS